MTERPHDIETLGLAQLGEAAALCYAIFKWLVILVVVLFLFSGAHTIEPGKEGQVMRFGRWRGEAEQPGFHWVFPFVVDKVVKFDVAEVRSINIDDFAPSEHQDAATPSQNYLMTRDGNIIHTKWQVTYVLSNPRAAYPYTGDDKKAEDSLLRSLFLNACVRAAAFAGVEDVLYRTAEFEAAVTGIFEESLDELGCGFRLVRAVLLSPQVPEKVKPAFDEVVRQSAHKERMKNDARSFALTIDQSTEAQTREMLAKAGTSAAEIRAKLKAEASAVEKILAGYDPETREAYLQFRLQAILKRALEEPGGQTFVLRNGKDVRIRINPDPVVKSIQEKARDKNKEKENTP